MDTRYRKKAMFLALEGVIVKDVFPKCLEDLVWKERVFSALHELASRTEYNLFLCPYRSFPREIVDRVLETISGEGIETGICVLEDGDETFSSFSGFRGGEWDLEGSFVITAGAEAGLAVSLGTGLIKLDDWMEAVSSLAGDALLRRRKASVERTTKETSISLSLDLDGSGKGRLVTGIAFFDHMLEQIVKHSRADIEGSVRGDLEVDGHHTVEDTAIVLGETVLAALGDKRGIERYGFETLMMDDVVATVAIDFSGRDEFIWDVEFTMDYVGTFPTELFRHFFRSFAASARANLYVSATRGGNSHHTAEIIFKAFARALRKAVRRIPGETGIPSSKGVL